ncbi:uncharacterized protein BDZ99DRAFT_246243 [Mytilinidion resinicola]|uniref:F-box domain-containing protein n=1 Tax=Mytilinidion resinicola TaxID=574789 RepID=A0A6A6YWP0_9PEZI|nr:uncharacterized protein BDZ99DRAFT_246243 [Mytilinidion resinicola]KAF2812939.1 hypothetical protein BDZ99DRAFT_246243 [Mytilinidion resinicola]
MTTVQLQRRYSFTSSTVLDGTAVTNASAAVRSPKTIALQPVETACNLCENPGVGVDFGQDRRPPKRDATQLPSPNANDTQSLPTKITRLALERDADDDIDSGYSDDGDVISPPPLRLESHDRLQHHLNLSQTEPLELEPYSDALPLLAAAPPPNPPHLLSLPPELRAQIYRYLPDTLISSRPLIYCLSTFAGRKQHPLAAVCRQIRQESLALFYGYNTWLIKLEFKIMYDAFRAWIRDLGDNAGELRLLQISVRGRMFRPVVGTAGGAGSGSGTAVFSTAASAGVEYLCVDGDATFRIDLSERYEGGEVEVVRCDGSAAAGERARAHLQGLVEPLWRKRREGRLRGADFLGMVDLFLGYTGWWC